MKMDSIAAIKVLADEGDNDSNNRVWFTLQESSLNWEFGLMRFSHVLGRREGGEETMISTN